MMLQAATPLGSSAHDRIAGGLPRKRYPLVLFVGLGFLTALACNWTVKEAHTEAFFGATAEEPKKTGNPCEAVGGKALVEGFKTPLATWHKTLTAEQPIANFGQQADDAFKKTLASFDALEKKAGLSCSVEREKLGTALTHVIFELYRVQAGRIEKQLFLELHGKIAKKPEDLASLVPAYLASVEKALAPLEPPFLKGMGETHMGTVKIRLAEFLQEIIKKVQEAQAAEGKPLFSEAAVQQAQAQR